ncbi:hypothetical protein FRC09_016752 [Ceratobasidium sp. 395]|nr:hypothetical protein FRC09_016752 [Ceratobasidium sp. 395]
MSKRPVTESKLSESSEGHQSSSKKARTDDSSLNPGSVEEKTPVVPQPVPPPARTRDPQYYYKDGSVILLVKDTLFKVHASLLEAQSEILKNTFASLSPDSDAKPQELIDDPIETTGVTVPEFRNLLMVFYSLPSSKLFLGTQGIKQPIWAWRSFVILTDVARLSQMLRMVEIEKWAANQLRSPMKTSSTHVAAGAKEIMKEEVPYKFFFALCYSIAISDTSLAHDIRNLIQCYCTLPTCLPARNIVAVLHHPQLRQQDPSLFGFLFVTLLNFGYNVWEQEHFTKEDRIACFSAQCYLTPLPESLGKDLILPLLVKPAYSKIGYIELFGDGNCIASCRRRLSSAWRTTFDSSYYLGVTSNVALKSTGQLGRLPSYRLEFANAISSHNACAYDCCAKALLALDTDISTLFERLAGYYRGVN